MQLKGWNTYYADSCSKSWPKEGRKMLQKGQVVINILWMQLCAVFLLNNLSFLISSKSWCPSSMLPVPSTWFFWKFGQIALGWADSLEVHFQVLELFCFWNYTSSWKVGDEYGVYGTVTKGTCSEETWLKVCLCRSGSCFLRVSVPSCCLYSTQYYYIMELSCQITARRVDEKAHESFLTVIKNYGSIVYIRYCVC